MHRLRVGLVVTLTSAGLAVLAPLAPAGADDRDLAPISDPISHSVSATVADARAALTGRSGLDGGSGREASLTLAGLRLAYPGLSSADRAAADVLLARPTDGAGDPEQFGYSVPEATPLCGTTFCVHYVPISGDSPSPTDLDVDGVPDWVESTLVELESVLAFESGTLGYRPPPTDGARGGSALFDVYLKDIGSQGLYGFCAPESKTAGERFAYSGYCVLDNDFAEFPLGPEASRAVTAAHEFFHAIQFGYDATEDRWLLEATATWMEERYADDVDDNRQYLRYGQLGRPSTPLDSFDPAGAAQYGNWLFFELISQRFGDDAIRRIWNLVDSVGNAPDKYSTEAVRKVAASRGRSFADFYARFATANQAPREFYSEGTSYRSTKAVRAVRLAPKRRQVSATKRLDHLTSAAYRFTPSGALGRPWRLRLAVDAPATSAGSAATALIDRRHGGLTVRTIKLGRDGNHTVTLDFSHRKVASVTLVLANASTRYQPCWAGTAYACQGKPRDDDDDYTFVATITR